MMEAAAWEAASSPMVLDHIRNAPDIFHVFWTATSAITLLTLVLSFQHGYRLLMAGFRIREEMKSVFLPTLASLYLKTFVFFPLCSLLSWTSLLLLRFALMLQLLLHLYEVGCLMWFWEIMSSFLNGPEAAFQVLHLATSMDPVAIARLVAATTQMQAELESPARLHPPADPDPAGGPRSSLDRCAPTASAGGRALGGLLASAVDVQCAPRRRGLRDAETLTLKSSTDEKSSVTAWLSYLRTVQLGPYRVLAAPPFCWLPVLRSVRTFTKSDLLLSRYLVVQYGVACILTVLARAVLAPRIAVFFQVTGFASLVLCMYGLLILLLATRRIVPRAETQLELKFAVIKLIVFVVKGGELLLRVLPVPAYPPRYSQETMRSAWLFVAVNLTALPLAVAAMKAYDPADVTRRYTAAHSCRSGLLVDLLLRLEQPSSTQQRKERETRLNLLCRSLQSSAEFATLQEDEEGGQEEDVVLMIRSLTPCRPGRPACS